MLSKSHSILLKPNANEVRNLDAQGLSKDWKVWEILYKWVRWGFFLKILLQKVFEQLYITGHNVTFAMMGQVTWTWRGSVLSSWYWIFNFYWMMTELDLRKIHVEYADKLLSLKLLLLQVFFFTSLHTYRTCRWQYKYDTIMIINDNGKFSYFFILVI